MSVAEQVLIEIDVTDNATSKLTALKKELESLGAVNLTFDNDLNRAADNVNELNKALNGVYKSFGDIGRICQSIVKRCPLFNGGADIEKLEDKIAGVAKGFQNLQNIDNKNEGGFGRGLSDKLKDDENSLLGLQAALNNMGINARTEKIPEERKKIAPQSYDDLLSTAPRFSKNQSRMFYSNVVEGMSRNKNLRVSRKLTNNFMTRFVETVSSNPNPKIAPHKADELMENIVDSINSSYRKSNNRISDSLSLGLPSPEQKKASIQFKHHPFDEINFSRETADFLTDLIGSGKSFNEKFIQLGGVLEDNTLKLNKLIDTYITHSNMGEVGSDRAKHSDNSPIDVSERIFGDAHTHIDWDSTSPSWNDINHSFLRTPITIITTFRDDNIGKYSNILGFSQIGTPLPLYVDGERINNAHYVPSFKNDSTLSKYINQVGEVIFKDGKEILSSVYEEISHDIISQNIVDKIHTLDYSKGLDDYSLGNEPVFYYGFFDEDEGRGSRPIANELLDSNYDRVMREFVENLNSFLSMVSGLYYPNLDNNGNYDAVYKTFEPFINTEKSFEDISHFGQLYSALEWYVEEVAPFGDITQTLAKELSDTTAKIASAFNLVYGNFDIEYSKIDLGKDIAYLDERSKFYDDFDLLNHKALDYGIMDEDKYNELKDASWNDEIKNNSYLIDLRKHYFDTLNKFWMDDSFDYNSFNFESRLYDTFSQINPEKTLLDYMGSMEGVRNFLKEFAVTVEGGYNSLDDNSRISLNTDMLISKWATFMTRADKLWDISQEIDDWVASLIKDKLDETAIEIPRKWDISGRDFALRNPEYSVAKPSDEFEYYQKNLKLLDRQSGFISYFNSRAKEHLFNIQYNLREIETTNESFLDFVLDDVFDVSNVSLESLMSSYKTFLEPYKLEFALMDDIIEDFESFWTDILDVSSNTVEGMITNISHKIDNLSQISMSNGVEIYDKLGYEYPITPLDFMEVLWHGGATLTPKYERLLFNGRFYDEISENIPPLLNGQTNLGDFFEDFKSLQSGTTSLTDNSVKELPSELVKLDNSFNNTKNTVNEFTDSLVGDARRLSLGLSDASKRSSENIKKASEKIKEVLEGDEFGYNSKGEPGWYVRQGNGYRFEGINENTGAESESGKSTSNGPNFTFGAGPTYTTNGFGEYEDAMLRTLDVWKRMEGANFALEDSFSRTARWYMGAGEHAYGIFNKGVYASRNNIAQFFGSISSGLQSASMGFFQLGHVITSVFGSMGLMGMVEQAWTQAVQRQTNMIYLTMQRGKDEAQSMYNEIMQVVMRLPGDDTFLTTILNQASARDPTMTAEDVKILGDAIADYNIAAQSKGQLNFETQRELTSYILTGQTRMFTNSVIADEINLLKNRNTVHERSIALQEALNKTGYEGMAHYNSAQNALETTKGHFVKAFADLGSMSLPVVEQILDIYNALDLFTDNKISAGIISITFALGGLLTVLGTIGFTLQPIQQGMSALGAGASILAKGLSSDSLKESLKNDLITHLGMIFGLDNGLGFTELVTTGYSRARNDNELEKFLDMTGLSKKNANLFDKLVTSGLMTGEDVLLASMKEGKSIDELMTSFKLVGYEDETGNFPIIDMMADSGFSYATIEKLINSKNTPYESFRDVAEFYDQNKGITKEFAEKQRDIVFEMPDFAKFSEPIAEKLGRKYIMDDEVLDSLEESNKLTSIGIVLNNIFSISNLKKIGTVVREGVVQSTNNVFKEIALALGVEEKELQDAQISTTIKLISTKVWEIGTKIKEIAVTKMDTFATKLNSIAKGETTIVQEFGIVATILETLAKFGLITVTTGESAAEVVNAGTKVVNTGATLLNAGSEFLLARAREQNTKSLLLESSAESQNTKEKIKNTIAGMSEGIMGKFKSIIGNARNLLSAGFSKGWSKILGIGVELAPIVTVVLEITAVVLLLVEAINLLGRVMGWWTSFKTMFEAIRDGISRIFNAFKNSEPIRNFVSYFTNFFATLRDFITGIGKIIGNIFNINVGRFDIVQTIINMFGKLGDVLMWVWGIVNRWSNSPFGIITWLNPLGILIFHLDEIGSLIEDIMDGWNAFVQSSSFDEVSKALSDAFNEIKEPFDEVREAFGELIDALVELFPGGTESKGTQDRINFIASIFKGIASIIKNVIVPALRAVAFIVRRILTPVIIIIRLVTGVVRFINSIVHNGVGFLNMLMSPVTFLFNILGGVKNTIDDIIDAIRRIPIIGGMLVGNDNSKQESNSKILREKVLANTKKVVQNANIDPVKKKAMIDALSNPNLTSHNVHDVKTMGGSYTSQNNQKHVVINQHFAEGSMPIDARNMTKKEAKQMFIGAFGYKKAMGSRGILR